jgi:hypothetical protein
MVSDNRVKRKIRVTIFLLVMFAKDGIEGFDLFRGEVRKKNSSVHSIIGFRNTGARAHCSLSIFISVCLFSERAIRRCVRLSVTNNQDGGMVVTSWSALRCG